MLSIAINFVIVVSILLFYLPNNLFCLHKTENISNITNPFLLPNFKGYIPQLFLIHSLPRRMKYGHWCRNLAIRLVNFFCPKTVNCWNSSISNFHWVSNALKKLEMNDWALIFPSESGGLGNMIPLSNWSKVHLVGGDSRASGTNRNINRITLISKW